jgi:hypothetical protein
MRIFTCLAAAFLAAFLMSSAMAATFETPKSLIEAVYADTDNIGNYDYPYQPFLSDHLLGLFKAEREASPDDPSNLDWDPVIAGQDGEASGLKIDEPAIDGDRATVKVVFTNFKPVTLYYSLVREHGSWKIDDIEQKDGEFPWTVSKQLTGQ